MTIDKQMADIVAQRNDLAFIAEELVNAITLPRNREFIHPELLALATLHAERLNEILTHWASSAGVFNEGRNLKT